MPCLWFDPYVESKEVGTGKYKGPAASYIVFQREAVDALTKVHPEAAHWWNSNGYPQHNDALWLFSANSVEVLKEVLTKAQLMSENN